MKHAPIVVVALILAISGCASTSQPVDVGTRVITETGTDSETSASNYCDGLSIEITSPSANERVDGGFRATWSLENSGSVDYTNSDVSFVISMDSTDIRTVKGVYGDRYSQDITFLSKVNPGPYIVGIRGSMTDCAIEKSSIPITVA